MISKILLRKCGFGKPKTFSTDARDNSSSANTEVVHGPEVNGNSQIDNNRSSSKFYVGVEDNLAISANLSSENSLQIADEHSGSVECIVSECIFVNDACVDSELNRTLEIMDKIQVELDLSSVSDKLSNSQVANLKPELKPKPKVSDPSLQLHMPSASTVFLGQSCSVLALSSPSVKLLPCVRTSIFPPAQDVWVHKATKCNRNEEKSEYSLSSDKMMKNVGNYSNSLEATRLAKRGSRRSFTTDDADIGLYKKPIMSPDLADLSTTANPDVIRRKPGSGVGLMVNTFERMTAYRRSRSFSSNQKVELPSVPELQPVSHKPKPPVKPRIVNWNQDGKAYLNCKHSSVLTSSNKTTAADCPNATSNSSKAETSYFFETPQELGDIVVEVEPQQNRENFSEKICNHLQHDIKESSFSDDDSELDDEDDEDWNEDDYSICNNEVTTEPEIITDKAQKVAEELLKTEEAYVSRLKLLDQVFLMEIMEQNRNEHFLPDDVIPQMFSSIKSIFLFHNDFLLPQLHLCMKDWNSGDKKIGLVLKKFAPFLKLYTDYVKNFENATNLITSYVAKSPRFATFLDELQSSIFCWLQRRPECGNLTLQHHLLEPIQRVPRYELLLRDYLKHLPEDSVDRVHASEALELVTRAAQHSNTEMRKIEKFRSLLDLKESLGGTLDLVDHTRELIKEGKIIKISARDGDHSERYLFLFSDMLLVCQSVPLKLGLRQQYTVKAKLDIRGMQVLEGNNLETANTFVIKSKQKSIEFCGSSLEYKDEWQRALWCAISEYTKKEHSRNTDQSLFSLFQEEELGKRAPTWVKDQEVTMCMLCTERFNTFKRRHHCRCCGKVVCKKCSAYKTKLAYDEIHEHRVCARCFSALGLQEAASVANIPGRSKACAVLQVNATDPSVISGYLQMSCDKKTWNRKFFAIHADFVLYSFKAHQDVIAHTSVPLPGFEVKSVEKTDEVQQREYVFSLTKPGFIDRASSKTYYFQADDESQRKRWIETLYHVVKLELPNSTSSGASLSSPSITCKSSLDTVTEQMKDGTHNLISA